MSPFQLNAGRLVIICLLLGCKSIESVCVTENHWMSKFSAFNLALSNRRVRPVFLVRFTPNRRFTANSSQNNYVSFMTIPVRVSITVLQSKKQVTTIINNHITSGLENRDGHTKWTFGDFSAGGGLLAYFWPKTQIVTGKVGILMAINGILEHSTCIK